MDSDSAMEMDTGEVDLIKEAADQVAPAPSTNDSVDEKDMETGQQEGSDWAMKECQQRH